MFRSEIEHGTATPTQPKSEDRTSMLNLLTRVWRAKFWALAGGIFLVLLCILITPVIKPSFEASAQIYVDPQNLQLLQNDLSPALSPGDSGVLIVESQARIMQSASVLRLVVEKLNLTSDEEFGAGGKGSLLSSLLGAFGRSSTTQADPVQQSIDKLGKAIHVVREDRTYLIEVYARSQSPTRAAEISNAVVEAYFKLRDTQRTGQANTASEALEGRLATLLATLNEKEDAVERFKVENDIVNANGTTLVENRLTQANLEVSTAADAMNKAQVERDQLKAMQSNPVLFLSSPQASASPDLTRLRADLERAQADVTSLSATLGGRHPRLVTAQGQLAAVRSSISAEMNRLASNAELNYSRAKAEYDAAVKALEPLTTQLQSADTARIQLRQLERDAESARALYDEALVRSRETREQAQVSTLNAQVVSQATVPIQKKSPPPLSTLLPLSLAIGLGLGLLLGMGYNRLREQSRETRRTDTFVEVHRETRPSPGHRARVPALARREAADAR